MHVTTTTSWSMPQSNLSPMFSSMPGPSGLALTSTPISSLPGMSAYGGASMPEVPPLPVPGDQQVPAQAAKEAKILRMNMSTATGHDLEAEGLSPSQHDSCRHQCLSDQDHLQGLRLHPAPHEEGSNEAYADARSLGMPSCEKGLAWHHCHDLALALPQLWRDGDRLQESR